MLVCLLAMDVIFLESAFPVNLDDSVTGQPLRMSVDAVTDTSDRSAVYHGEQVSLISPTVLQSYDWGDVFMISQTGQLSSMGNMVNITDSASIL